MLAAVLLHLHEPFFPVNTAFHTGSRLQRAFHQMQDPSVFFLYIRNSDAAQHSSIRILAASLREERRAVKLCCETAAVPRQDIRGHRLARQDFCLKLCKMAVLIKKFFRHCVITSFPAPQIREDRYTSPAHVLSASKEQYTPTLSPHFPQTGSLSHGKTY